MEEDIDILELYANSDNKYAGSIELEIKEAIKNLINKNKELEYYANWHIEHLTEDIQDLVDDDIVNNQEYIHDLKEDREHWKDIIRILNNEKTYIDYKNY